MKFVPNYYKFLLRFLIFFMVLSSSQITETAAEEDGEKVKKIAIVIDDFGNNMAGTEEILNLPIPLTVAVMPFLPSTKRDAEWAYQKGHDVIVHLPMEPHRGRKHWLGPGVITTNLSDDEIRKRVNHAIDDVPHAVGINNHMGSKATGDPRVMRVVLEVCKERDMIFLDSKTNYWSVGPSIAKELNVPYVENQLFLDDENNKRHIRKQCDLIRENLTKQDICIAIGHVGNAGKKTASVLKDQIPLIQQDAMFVKVSQILKDTNYFEKIDH